MAVTAVVVVLSLLPLVCRCFQQGQAEKCNFPKDPRLLFCRPVPYCAAEMLGEGSGLAVRAHCHWPPYSCFCSKPQLFSRLLSPWCVSSLESDL